MAELFVERLIGSIRRECVDHVVALGEQPLGVHPVHRAASLAVLTNQFEAAGQRA